MVTTYEMLALMISCSVLVLAFVDTIVNIVVQIIRCQQCGRNHKNTKK